jgi:hypothetical protein
MPLRCKLCTPAIGSLGVAALDAALVVGGQVVVGWWQRCPINCAHLQCIAWFSLKERKSPNHNNQLPMLNRYVSVSSHACKLASQQGGKTEVCETGDAAATSVHACMLGWGECVHLCFSQACKHSKLNQATNALMQQCGQRALAVIMIQVDWSLT